MFSIYSFVFGFMKQCLGVCRFFERYSPCFLKNAWKRINEITIYLIAFYQNKRIEPFKESWSSHSYLLVEKEPVPNYYFNEVFNTDSPPNLLNTCVLEHLYIDKKKDTKTYNLKDSHCVGVLPAKTRFLSIEYRKSLDSPPISIELKDEDYQYGNTILSPLFVLRYLKYNSPQTYFNMQYTLCIMDDSLNYFELDSTQYIILGKKEYIIGKTIDIKIDKKTS